MVTTGTMAASITGISLVPDNSELELPILASPKLDEKALYGLAGDVVRAGAYTNVEPAGLLITFLTAVASCISDTRLRVDNEYYPARLFSVLVGTSRARRGAFDHTKKFFAIEGESKRQREKRIVLNLNSWPLEMGNDFIEALTTSDHQETEPRLKAVSEPSMKHVLLAVPDFQRTLTAARHVHNALASMLSAAWDDHNLKLLTSRRERINGCKAHVCLFAETSVRDLGDLRKSNLRRLLSRILWVGLRPASEVVVSAKEDKRDSNNNLSTLLADVIANRRSELTLDKKSQSLWLELQRHLKLQSSPGVLEMIADIGETQVLRLATIYAVLDESNMVLPCHLQAAMALWQYCKASAQKIFTCNKADAVAGKILSELARASRTQTELHNVFGKHIRQTELNEALNELESSGLIVLSRSGGGPGKGQPTTRWSLTPGISLQNPFRGELA